MNLDGRVALVTGSSRGIGASIARRFAESGAKVAVNGRDEGAVESVCSDIVRRGGEAIGILADVTDFQAIERMRERIERELGPVDVLVANAGGNAERPGPIESISVDGWRASLDVNLTGTFLTIRSFLPGMKERKGGSIITISSAAARRPSPYSPVAYAAAKAGIELLTKDVAAQAGPSGVRANCIAPETILTERNDAQMPEETKRQLVESHPVRRLGTPDDVAEAALFLASDASAWISGVVLDVAGGSVL